MHVSPPLPLLVVLTARDSMWCGAQAAWATPGNAAAVAAAVDAANQVDARRGEAPAGADFAPAGADFAPAGADFLPASPFFS